MNKKLIAIAVGSALGAIGAPSVAFAQASTVTLSGNVNVGYGYYDNGGAGFAAAGGGAAGVAKVKTDAMYNSESEWVLAGQENLGGGLSAYFRCATTLDMWGGTASNMCARTSYVGLKGNFGSVSWGNHDTPMKRMIGLYDPFPIGAPHGQGGGMYNGTSSALGNGGSTVATAGTNSSFSRRQNNLITYDMPRINGFDAAIAYTAVNEATLATVASTIQKPRLWSAMVNYTNGPFMVGIGYEQHRDYNPGAVAAYTGGKDTSYQIGAAYTFRNALKVSAQFVRMNYDNITLGTDLSVRSWGVFADWAISGPHALRLGYGNQGDTKGSYAGGAVGTLTGNGGAGNSGSQKFMSEYGYSLSKRTTAYLHYSRQMNDQNSNQAIGTGGDTVNFGETQSFTGMRFQHRF